MVFCSGNELFFYTNVAAKVLKRGTTRLMMGFAEYAEYNEEIQICVVISVVPVFPKTHPTVYNVAN
jgi:hypothetical protein